MACATPSGREEWACSPTDNAVIACQESISRDHVSKQQILLNDFDSLMRVT